MSINHHYLVDRQHPLPSWYVPTDLVEAPIPFIASSCDPKRLICNIAHNALKNLVADSKKEGLSLYGISAYRSYYRQKEIYNESVKSRGIEYTKKYIALPGTSQHQTGLAIDISTPSINFDLIEEFANTNEGIWLAKNAMNYNFVISYPKGMELQTGFQYEPWHIFFTCTSAVYFIF